MKIKKFLANIVLNNLATSLTIIGTILSPILYFLHDSVQTLVSQPKEQSLISWILLVLIWLLLLESFALFILSHKRKAFGLYWDRNYNAFCPVCKTLCSYTENLQYGYGTFHCPKCERDMIPVSVQGAQLTHEQVIGNFQGIYKRKKH